MFKESTCAAAAAAAAAGRTLVSMHRLLSAALDVTCTQEEPWALPDACRGVSCGHIQPV